MTVTAVPKNLTFPYPAPMIDLKDLECIVALARHRHFARAAQACGLSQPAFSMRTRNLENHLQTPIVKRGNRFQQFTAEGEKLLAHARDMLDRAEALERDIRASSGELSGALVLGVVPTALAVATRLAIALNARHEGLRTRIITATSLAVQQGLEDGEFDAGLTYTDGVPGDLMQVEKIYDETYVLVAPEALVPGAEHQITWAEAAELPLTLLEPAMQNRKIIDQVFDSIGAAPKVLFESNGFNAALVIAQSGIAATVVPRVLIEELGVQNGITALPLVDPMVAKSVGFVVPRQSVGTAMGSALQEVLETLPQ